jgi:hypothetical protein
MEASATNNKSINCIVATTFTISLKHIAECKAILHYRNALLHCVLQIEYFKPRYFLQFLYHQNPAVNHQLTMRFFLVEHCGQPSKKLVIAFIQSIKSLTDAYIQGVDFNHYAYVNTGISTEKNAIKG